MSVSIINCPSCKTMLFNDTAQCPNCNEILNENSSVREDPNAKSSSSSSSENEENAECPCPECGEMVRTGLVRCWNCSTFMRSEIAALYQQMKASDRPVIYSQPQMDREELSVLEDAEDVIAGDAEFELSSEFQLESPEATKEKSANIESTNETASTLSEKTPADRQDIGTTSKDESETATSQNADSDTETQTFIDEFVSPASSKPIRRANMGNGNVLDGVRVYCPNGHRIIVQERHRGLTGRCPKCKSSFVVPGGKTDAAAESDDSQQRPDDSSIAGKFRYWVHDVSYHELNPERLRLKAGSMKNTAQPKDLGFSQDTFLIVSLNKKGAKVSNKNKANEIRSQIHRHLKENGKLEEVPVGSCEAVSLEDFKNSLKIVLPTDNPEDSMFAGIPVFGEQRIVVRIPPKEDSQDLRFLSLTLSTYRQLHKILTEVFGVENFGDGLDVPLTDGFMEIPCFYTSEKIRFLKGAREYQEADPAYKLKLVGRQCSSCKMVIGEEVRKKEKFGGSAGKTLAKTTCPKCQNLFGTDVVYDVANVEKQPAFDDSEKFDDE